METMNWYDEENPVVPENLSVNQLEELCDKISQQRAVCDEISSKHKLENQKLDALEKSLLAALEAMHKDSYKSNVGTFSVTHRTSVRVPQGDEKLEFLDYLRSRGVHDAMVTVNSQTLNGWYRQEFDAAKANGTLLEFKIPGLGEPTINKLISFRKATN